MSTEALGPKALIGQLRETGLSVTLANRIEELLALFGNNLPQFCALSKAALEAAYVKSHPGARGLGAKTYDAFNRFVRLWKQSLYDAKQVAKATVEEQERKEAEKAELRRGLLAREVDFDAMTAAMAALGTLGLKTCGLGRLLEMHDMAKGAKSGLPSMGTAL